MPVALHQPTDAARRTWFRNYLDLAVQRDVLDIRRIRQRDALPRLLQGLIAQTGQLLNMARAAEKAGLNRAVGSDHVTLFEAVFAIHRLPAWGTTLSARVNSAPKVQVFDTGLGGWLLRLAAEPLRRGDPTAWEQFGHLLESFVVNELRRGGRGRGHDLGCLPGTEPEECLCRLSGTARPGVRIDQERPQHLDQPRARTDTDREEVRHAVGVKPALDRSFERPSDVFDRQQ